MLKPDFRQYEQSRSVTMQARTVCLWTPRRSAFETLTARREAANLLLHAIGNSYTENMADFSEICKNRHGVVQDA